MFYHINSQADQERADRQREYLSQLAEDGEYESSEATSLATNSTMEGEHVINQEQGRDMMEQDSCSTTPQECLSPDHDTPTPTPSVSEKREKVRITFLDLIHCNNCPNY